MKRKTIIFFPVEIGIAHLTRCLAIAQELKRRKHKIIFAVPKRKKDFVGKAGLTPYLVPPLSDRDDLSFLKNLNNINYIASLVKSELSLLEKHKPDCAVIDFRLTAVAACTVKNIPTIFLTGGGGLPYGCYLPNPGIPHLLYLLASPLIQKAIWLLKTKYVKNIIQVTRSLNKNYDYDEIFFKMTYIVPENRDYLPPLNQRLIIHHVGPIFWQGFDAYKPSWLDSIRPSGKTIYLTFGGTGFDKEKLVNLSQILISAGYTIVVSSSTIASVFDFPKHERLFVSPYVSGLDICKRVDMVVCHGGYGTMMQSILSGSPVIAIPFNPDQFLHAFRFQELGLAKCLVNFRLSFLTNFYKSDWQAIQDMASKTNLDKVIDAVEEVFANKTKYQKAIERFKKDMPREDSIKKAADIIENLKDAAVNPR